jgi:mono/diheme cytochrome c family protein
MRAVSIVLLGSLFIAGPASAGPFADYSGRQLYERFCASCHGPSGYGDGPVASSLKVMVPDLTGMYKRSGSKFPEDRVRRIIDGRQLFPVHGTRDMPVWGQEFWVEGGGDKGADAEAQIIIDRLVEYLRSIQQ